MKKFFELYLKYKFLNPQKGGGNNKSIDIISFNVLNSDFNYSINLFKNYSEQIKQIYSDNLTKKELIQIIKNLVKIEIKEFELYRKQKILILINYWITSNHIVCLQEVNNSLLGTLSKIYGNQLKSTFNNDIQHNDYRVTIVPKSYRIIKTDKLIFDNKIKVNECLITHIKDNKNELIIFNLHIHWKSKESDYYNFAKQIKEYIELNKNSVSFIICGDFNCSINSPYFTNFTQEINDKFKLDFNSNNYNDDYTSYDTKNENTKGWIDHILSHNLINNSPTQTTNKIKNLEIFYDVNQLIENIVKLNKSVIKTKEFNITKKNLEIFKLDSFVSDHKPVYASFGYY
jgi:endonuclease/exonuclease/phosphatase family metal-dependent hydrolase